MSRPRGNHTTGMPLQIAVCMHILRAQTVSGDHGMIRYRFLFALAAIVAALVMVTMDAHARAGGGFSGGSRGMRSFSAPPVTRTAPTTAAPLQRTLTQPGSQTGARPGLFGGGLFGGLA